MSLIVPIMKPVIDTGSTYKTWLAHAWEFNELTGVIAYDSKNSLDGDNDGAIVNGSYYAFNSDNVAFGSGLPFQTGGRSIEILFRLSNTTQDHTLFSKWDASGTADYNDFSIFWDYSGNREGILTYRSIVYVINFGSSVSNWLWKLTANYAVNDTDWHHLVISHDWGVGVTMYVDGAVSSGYADNPTSTSGSITSNTIYAGQSLSSGSPTQPLNGDIDFIRTYNHALDASDVEWLYNSGNYRTYNEL